MKYISCILKINFYGHIGRFKLLTGHYPRSEQKTWPLFISILINIFALACVDVLFTEAEPANGNTSDTFGYEKLDESKTRYLSLALRQKFASTSFESQREAMRVT